MKVFVSHASEDAKVATEVAMALRGAGHEVFFDADDLPASGDYNTRIRDAIEASDAFVFLLSPHAIDAGSYTLTELRFARQKWPRPWGHVLPVMIADVPWSDIDPYLASITVLRPAGHPAAETVDALARLPESAEVKAAAARWHSPLFALTALGLLLCTLAAGLTALSFGAASPAAARAGQLWLLVVAALALPMLVVGAVLRRRDAAVRSLGQAWRTVAARPWFGALGMLVTLAGATGLTWPLVTTGTVVLRATQAVELRWADGPGPGRPLGSLAPGVARSVQLPVGRHTLVYRAPDSAPDEIGVLDDVVVPTLWSRRRGDVVTLPPLQGFGRLREKEG